MTVRRRKLLCYQIEIPGAQIDPLALFPHHGGDGRAAMTATIVT